jgi:hypothetical protein
MLLLFLLLRQSPALSPRALFGIGLVTGILISVQQQRGLVVAAGVAVTVAVHHAVEARYAAADWRQLGPRLLALAAGIALVVVPLLLAFVIAAGGEAVLHALVYFPLSNYRGSFRTTWGSVAIMNDAYAQYTIPVLLAYLPLALAPALLRVAYGVAARGQAAVRTQPAEVCRLTILVLSAAFAAASIWYFPDFIHIAFIAPALLVGVVESLEWALARLPSRAALLTGRLICAVLVAGLLLHLSRNWARAWDTFSVPHDTAFGRIDYGNRWEPLLVDKARALLATGPSREIFCYPNLASYYLTTGGKNPTPFQHFFAPVFPPADTAAVLATLETRRVPYIVGAFIFMRASDPVARLINTQYEPVDIPALENLGETPAILLYGRKDSLPAAAAGSGAANDG